MEPTTDQDVISRRDLAVATRAAADVLDGMALEAYRFAVEPRGEHWAVIVECPFGGVWTELTFLVPHDDLAASADEESTREDLRRAWRGQLEAATRRH